MNCQYTEKMPHQEWTIHADTLAILNFYCQKQLVLSEVENIQHGFV